MLPTSVRRRFGDTAPVSLGHSGVEKGPCLCKGMTIGRAASSLIHPRCALLRLVARESSLKVCCPSERCLPRGGSTLRRRGPPALGRRARGDARHAQRVQDVFLPHPRRNPALGRFASSLAPTTPLATAFAPIETETSNTVRRLGRPRPAFAGPAAALSQPGTPTGLVRCCGPKPK